MSKVKNYTDEQNKALEYVKQGYMVGAIGAQAVMRLLKDVGLPTAEQISWLETFALQKGMESRGAQNA
jgi:hypothetical protein